MFIYKQCLFDMAVDNTELKSILFSLGLERKVSN